MTRTKGIPCPVCGKSTKVRRSVEREGYIYRRRKCTDAGCGGSLSTTERAAGSATPDKTAIVAQEFIADILEKCELSQYLEVVRRY